MPEDILIFGAGGHARVVADAAEASAAWRVAAFVVTAPLGGSSMQGREIWPDGDVLTARRGPDAGIVAIGDNAVRQRIVERIRASRPDFRFVTVVHPRAVLSAHARVGEGSVLLAGAIVNPAAVVGAHVALYTNAIVEHDDVIGDFASLAPAAALGGAVTIGARSFVGMGAVVIHGRKVGADTVVGAHATVVADLPDRVVALGTPARVVRSREPGEPYL